MLLDPEDVSVLGMLVHGVPPSEIAEVLGISDSWLDTRRWAMLERLKGAPGRRRAENGPAARAGRVPG